MKSLRLKALERWIVPVLILVGWEIFSRSGTLPAALLPAPTTVLRSWADWVFAIDGNTQTYSGSWIFDTAASLTRVMAGFGIATALGVSLGVAIGGSRRIETIIEPTLQVLRPIPPVSWIPLAIIWFGIANKPAIFLVFLGSFFPILLNTIHGVKSCDRNLIRAGAMVGGDQRQLLRYIVLPAALPSIFAGLRTGRGEERPRLCAVGFLLFPALRSRARRHGQHRTARLSQRPGNSRADGACPALAAQYHHSGRGGVRWRRSRYRTSARRFVT